MVVDSRVSPASISDQSGAQGTSDSAAQPPLLTELWTFWKAYAHRASTYQSIILLALVYYLVLGPSAILARAFGTRLLDSDPGERATYWLARKPMEHSLDSMGRQF